MNNDLIEKDIFKRSVVDSNKLIKFGFKKVNDKYVIEKDFLNNDFKAIISIDSNSNVTGKIIDLQMNEEYLNINSMMDGVFVNKVRNEYKNILIDIRDNCFINKLFISNQANRIANYIKTNYKCDPEFLWDDSPGCGVFRNNKTNKWFGIIMNVDYSKLDNRNGEIEVLNIKLNEKEIIELLKEKGFYKAYHMNKKSWISIVLNDVLDDNIIFSLIDESYGNVS